MYLISFKQYKIKHIKHNHLQTTFIFGSALFCNLIMNVKSNRKWKWKRFTEGLLWCYLIKMSCIVSVWKNCTVCQLGVCVSVDKSLAVPSRLVYLVKVLVNDVMEHSLQDSKNRTKKQTLNRSIDLEEDSRERD